jgi:hypothetical protein
MECFFSGEMTFGARLGPDYRTLPRCKQNLEEPVNHRSLASIGLLSLVYCVVNRVEYGCGRNSRSSAALQE